jgi:hypothetical protein
MEREWPRVKPYTDLAVGDLRSLFDNLILPDGGFMEPPTYAIGTVRGGYRMFENVARARGQSISDVTPERIKRTGAYSAAVASTLPGSDVITVGDSGDTLGLEPLVLLSSLAPKSSWLALLRKRLTPEKTDALPYDLRHMVDALPAKTPPMPPFVLLPETGLAASTRMFGDEFIKVFVRGNGGGTFHDHEHEDTGSFVIEFAGEAFAMDPGIVEYDDPSHELLKHCERHNMLVPVVDGARPRPVEKIVKPVTPHGKGGKKAFNVELDITPAWAPHYKHWARRIDSRAPDELMIRDEYELAQGGGVDFFWQTALPCHVEGGTVVIQGKKGRATLTAGAGCSVRIQELPKVGETAQRRIAFRKEGIRGTVEVGVHFGTN